MIYELTVAIVVLYQPFTLAISKPVEYPSIEACAVARQEVLENFGGTKRYHDNNLRLFAAQCEPKGARDETGLVKPEFRDVPFLQ